MGFKKIDIFIGSNIFRQLDERFYSRWNDFCSKGKQKQAIGKYDLDNLLQWIDLYDFEDYLFGENYLFISTGNEKIIVRYKEISVEELLNLFRETDDLSLSDPFSLWSEVFSKYMCVDLEEIRKDMELIREGILWVTIKRFNCHYIKN